MSLHVQRGSGAPAAAPTDYAQHYIDGDTGDLYQSSGIASVADWQKLLVVTAGLRVLGGTLQLINADTGLWHTVGVRNNVDGDAVIYVEEDGIP